MPAETEGIGEDDIDIGGATDVGDIIEIATFFWIFEIDRGGDNPVLDGEGGSNDFDPTCAAEEVSSHGFSRTDGNLIRMVAQSLFDRGGLRGIVDGCAGTVSVDIADGFGC